MFFRKSVNSEASSSEESESSSDESSSAEEQINTSNHIAKSNNSNKALNDINKNGEQKSNLDLLLDFCDGDTSAPVLTPSLGKIMIMSNYNFFKKL